VTRKKKILCASGFLLVALALGVVTINSQLQLKQDPNEIKVGAKAPELSLLDSAGQAFKLDSIPKSSRPVLIFYRGSW
jgi:hypothetical protein